MELINNLPTDVQIIICDMYDSIYSKRMVLYYKKHRAVLRASKLFRIDKIISKSMDTYTVSYVLGIVTINVSDNNQNVLRRTTEIISDLKKMKQYWRDEDWALMTTVSFKKYGNPYGFTNILDIWDYCSNNVDCFKYHYN